MLAKCRNIGYTKKAVTW